MLKALIGVRLHAMFSGLFKGSKKGKSAGPAMKILFGVLGVYVIGVFLMLFGLLFFGLYDPLKLLGLRALYFAIAGFIALMLGFVGSVFATQTQLYDAKDNELLLSMPVPSWMILISRMIALYLYNLLFTLLVMLPAGVIYWIKGSASPLNVVSFTLGCLLLPLGSLTLSCLFGWIFAWLGSRMRNKNLLSLIVSVAFFAVYFWAISRSDELLGILLSHYQEVMDFLKTAGWPAWQLGLAAGMDDALALVKFVLCMAVPFLITLYLLGRSFITIATRQKGGIRIKYKKRAMKVAGVRKALLMKELKHFSSSVGWMMNGGVGLMFLLVLPVMLLANSDMIGMIQSELGLFLAQSDLMLYAALIGCIILTMCTISAGSVSLEGKSLSITQSLPVDAGLILLAKSELQMVVSLPFALVAVALSAIALKAGIVQILLSAALLTVFTVLVSLTGTALNVRFPKFDWTSETAAVKQGMSVVFTMLLGMAYVAVPAGLYIWLLRDIISLNVFVAVLIVLYAEMNGLYYRYLTHGGKRRFERL